MTASNLIAMACNLLAMASNLLAMACNLIAMACNLLASFLSWFNDFKLRFPIFNVPIFSYQHYTSQE